MLDSQNKIDEMLSLQYIWRFLKDKKFKISIVTTNTELIDDMNFIQYISHKVNGNIITLSCINPKGKYSYRQCKIYCIISYVIHLILLELRNHNINRHLSDTLILSRIGINGDLENKIDALICKAAGYQNKYISKTKAYEIIKQIAIHDVLKDITMGSSIPDINFSTFNLAMKNFDKYLFSETSFIYYIKSILYKGILDSIVLCNIEMTNDSLIYHS